MVYATRKSRFCAAHRYYDKAVSAEENRVLFGKCMNTHGHNYELEVTVSGTVDERTGMVVNLSDLDVVVRHRVLDILDHKNLDVDIDEFKNVIPSTEMIAQFIWGRLEGQMPGCVLYRVRLHEDEDLYADYYGEEAS